MSRGDSNRADPGAVESLLAVVQEAFEGERSRGKDLDTKTASLAAFSGTILALDVNLGSKTLEQHLGAVGDIVVPCAFLFSAVALLVAAGIAVAGVLRPQPYLGLDPVGIKELGKNPLVLKDKTEVQGTALETIGELINGQTPRNDRKARLAGISAVTLVAGLAGITVQAGTLGLHALGI
jgi:hypothetical protein